ncbi:hypothetical protein [Nocardioides sp. zg-DK7169]|uniref:hypothetical protein n=1 Tax=Nocardioides sp. zg-DK7169 TaxID=2736600 RepID=UPI001555E2F3|nr:hypothetical protein [Nocardioides sp. zg-DK7169]NPC98176.1 hypothetical protein [Nocardioides sp. zg-DK7169]
MAALVDALVAAKFRLEERAPGSARLRVGSWRNDLIVDAEDIQTLIAFRILPRRFAAWTYSAHVDLDALDTAPSQVRVRMHKVWGDRRSAVPHLLGAVDAAIGALHDAGHDAEDNELVEGR